MKELKREILFVLLFMVIGIAVVSTNVVVNMSTSINQNPDDFLVYFSDVEVDGTQDLSLVENEQKLVFNGEFTAVGDKKVISYDVTNASKNYDAEILIDCTESTTYLNITNVFDMKSSLSARSTRTGTLTIELSNAVSEEVTQEVTCTISANAVERDSQGSGDVVNPVVGPYMIGYEMAIGDELFNVISTSDKEIQLLAKQALNGNYKQSNHGSIVFFADSSGWEYAPGPKEIDIQRYGSNVKTYVNGYVEYLKELTGYDNISGDLITLSQLGSLGCDISTDYSFDSNLSYGCYDSEYSSWLIDDFSSDYWWTKSAVSNIADNIWYVNYDVLHWHVAFPASVSTGYLYIPSVRPVITMSKETYNTLLSGIISFTINDIVYEAEVGMTWEEWVESDYSGADFRIKSSEYIAFEGFEFVYNSGNNIVLVSDKITANGSYYLFDGVPA